MVFKFRLITDEEKDFIRDIEILTTQSFYDLHQVIMNNLHYDQSQISSFFITNQNWEKETEITLFDMSDGQNKKNITMDRALLKDYIKEPKQRLLFVFDFFCERGFFMELIDISKQLDYVEYPRVVMSKGQPPKQILIDNSGFGNDFNINE